MIKRHEVVEFIANDLSDSTIEGVLMTEVYTFNGGLTVEFFEEDDKGKMRSDKYKISVELIAE